MKHNEEWESGWLSMEPREPASPAGPGGGSPQNAHFRAMNNQNRPHTEPRPVRAPPPATIDPWTFIEVVLRRWRWLALSSSIMALFAAGVGMHFWKSTRTAVAQLMRYEPMGMSDNFKPALLTPDTFAGLLKAPELLDRVATNARPPVSSDMLAKCVFIKTDPDSDIVKVGVRGRDAQLAVYLANLYAAEAVKYTRDLQQREATEVNKNYLQQGLADMDREINGLQEQFKALPNSAPLAGKLNQISGTVSNLSRELQLAPRVSIVTARLNERLQSAIDELGVLTRKYKDTHPLVQQQKEQIESIQRQIADAATNSLANGPGMAVMSGGTTSGGPAFDPVYEIIRAKLQALDDSRQRLADRQREAQAFAANPPGIVRTFAPATLKTIVNDRRWLKIGIAAVIGGVLGAFFASGGVLLIEVLDERLKTADDLRRVAKLPVIATLDDLSNKGLSARERWAFRTWTMLQGRLSPSANQGLVCGITSSQAGEGRSTWINLLADAATMSGFRVLTIATRPVGNPPEEPPEQVTNGEANGHTNGAEKSNMLTTNVLVSPGEVTEQLAGPNPQPLVHIPLPGWVWNLERRQQWQQALDHWRKIDNVVILVELPPAGTPEAVLLGQNLPNLVWLANSGTASAGETRAQLETLRHARCKLVGAVLNRETSRSLKNRFPRWIGCVLLFSAWSLLSARAQNNPPDTNPAPAIPHLSETQPQVVLDTNISFSVVNPATRAPWQKRLTLGPGDVLTFSLYGQTDLTKSDVFIGPDGRVSYLEAQNLLATGLTVDELRTNIDNELAKYRRAPRSVVTPVVYQSKKYYMLGKVVQRGAYTLDRPITVIEAVARARGLETGLADRNTLELADFQKSFLMRNGKRTPINFEKLFEQGDLSQNLALEPGDYLYFPAAGLKEVYVVGEVRFPGVVAYTSELTVIGALSARGGFTDRAYKSRVLIIRGSLANPKPYPVDTRQILDAREQDFKLESKDIIYVSARPFIRVEDLVDSAITAFLQSVTAEWTGKNTGLLFPAGFVPSP